MSHAVAPTQRPFPSLPDPLARLYTLKQRGVAALLGPMAGLWHAAIGPREREKGDPRLFEALQRVYAEALAADYANADAGLYPKSLLLPLPGWHDVRFLPEALLDMPRIFRRKREGAYEVEPGAEALPDYYRRAFHWQTDGWLSAHSARIYELQVEFLFFGTMDIMRRSALAALVKALGGDRERMRVRVLDVACGTGRFLKQAKAALPQAELEGVDLSPFYVARARARLHADDRTVRVANAESLGGDDGAYDAVTSGFLLHEMPRDVRRTVARELLRVVEPGGVAVIQDSLQKSDPLGKELAPFLDWFPRAYHEPYYKGYVEDDVAGILEEVGFEVKSQQTVLLSKVVVARKPR